jgi:ADP-heptose:LPS heptosyltransferase
MALGDVLRATVFTNALRRTIPDAHVTFAVGDYASIALLNNPDIDNLLPMGLLGTPRRYNLGSYLAFAQKLRRDRYDVAFVLDRSPAMTLLPYLARIPYRIGLDSQYRGFSNTTRVSILQDENEISAYRRLAASVGIDASSSSCVFCPNHEDTVMARRLAEEFSPAESLRHILIAPGGGMNPGAVDLTKRWPAERYAALGDRLINDFDVHVSLIGTASDANSIGAVKRAMTAPVTDLTGRTSFGQLGALMSQSHLVVGNDSAATHLSVSVGTPTVTVFTSTEPWIYGSDSDHDVPIYTGSPNEGLGKIPTVAMVLAAARQLLRSAPTSPPASHPPK